MGRFGAILESLGETSPLYYILVAVFVNMLPIPGVSGIICTLGGTAFGTIYGTLIFSTAATIGATIALIFVRYFFREPLKRWILSGGPQRANMLKSLDVAVEDEAFQIVFLLRMSPVMPFGLASLLLALTSVPELSFTCGTFLGVLPASIPYAYAGALAGSLAFAGAGDGSKLKAVMTLLGLLATVLVSWRVAVIAQRVLDAQAIGGGQDGEAQALQANGEKGGIFALPAKDKSAKRRDPIATPAANGNGTPAALR